MQKLADGLCEDNEIQYVSLNTKKTASLDKIIVGDKESIYTKLKQYPYEFEINSSLQLASIDGVKVDTNTQNSNNIYKEEEQAIGTWIDGKTIYRKIYKGIFGEGKSNANQLYIDASSNNINEIISITEKALVDNRTTQITIPAYYSTEGYTSCWYNIHKKTIVLRWGPQYDRYTNNEYTIIVEYTKQ